jgi:uncharacterized DUF497 family protein
MCLQWIWDAEKNRTNRNNHGISFDGGRWQTIGVIGIVAIFVVHTWPNPDGESEETGRIISARKATPHERRAYEEGDF